VPGSPGPHPRPRFPPPHLAPSPLPAPPQVIWSVLQSVPLEAAEGFLSELAGPQAAAPEAPGAAAPPAPAAVVEGADGFYGLSSPGAPGACDAGPPRPPPDASVLGSLAAPGAPADGPPPPAEDSAVAVYWQVLERQRAELGPGHPDTATTARALADVLAEGGDPARALPLLVDAVRAHSSACGNFDARTATSLLSLARCQARSGDGEAALRSYEGVVTILEALGDGFPAADSVAARRELGELLAGAGPGARARAAEAFRSAADVSLRRLGPQHAETWGARVSAGRFAHRAGLHEWAVDLLAPAVAGLADPGESDPAGGPGGEGLASVTDWLAEAYAATGRHV